MSGVEAVTTLDLGALDDYTVPHPQRRIHRPEGYHWYFATPDAHDYDMYGGLDSQGRVLYLIASQEADPWRFRRAERSVSRDE